MLEKSDFNNNNKTDNKKDNINDYIFPQYEEQQIKEAFDVFDFNGNNFISVNELKEIFNYIKEEVTEEELDEMINLADKEGDGQVNWVNFYEFISGKTIRPDVKDMKKTAGLYPEDKYNQIQHLKKSKIEFMDLNNNEINHDEIETKRVNKGPNKNNIINNISPKDKILNENGEKNIKNVKKKKKISIKYNKDEENNNINNEFEDAKVDNYVQEILKKRQEKIQNNYFVNKAKIKDIEDKPKKVGKKLIYIDNSQKKQIVTNGSLNESSSEVKSNDSNNSDNNNKKEKNMEDKETNKTKVSNFLPLDRTNTMKKINPIIQEINNENEKSEKSIDEVNINKNSKKKGSDSKEENDEDKQNEISFVKKKVKKIKITPKNKKSKKKVIKKEKEKEKEKEDN